MWNDRRALDLLGIPHPILQAPMAGSTSPGLVAAVCAAGGLGGLGAAAMRPEALRATIAEIRELTDRPFNVNLFDRNTEHYDSAEWTGSQWRQKLEELHRERGLGPVPEPSAIFGPADDQLEVLIDERVAVISLHFGVDASTVSRARSAGARVLCTATTVAEALVLEAAGVDAIIAQGSEAGGHRGTFAGDYRQSLIGTMALVPRVVDAVAVPVIAAGGIMDARGIVASLALGAAAVQIGTAFLGCPEAPVADAWREALDLAEGESTVITEAISGKPARGLANRLIAEFEEVDEPLLPYPAQYSISSELRRDASRRGDSSFMAMWAGQGVGLFQQKPVADLMKQWIDDSQQLIARLAEQPS